MPELKTLSDVSSAAGRVLKTLAGSPILAAEHLYPDTAQDQDIRKTGLAAAEMLEREARHIRRAVDPRAHPSLADLSLRRAELARKLGATPADATETLREIRLLDSRIEDAERDLTLSGISPEERA